MTVLSSSIKNSVFIFFVAMLLFEKKIKLLISGPALGFLFGVRMSVCECVRELTGSPWQEDAWQ